MNLPTVQSLLHSRYPLAVASGLLLAAAFPNIGIPGFAWIAPGLMLAAGLGTRGAERFRVGYIAGFTYYLALLHWLLFIPVTGFPILGWMALSAYLALFPATWVWLAGRAASSESRVPGTGLGKKPAELSPPGNWLAALGRIASWSWTRRAGWALFCAALWVTMEMLVGRLLGGFPWNLLGGSQHRILPLIQIASLTGVCGLSFLVAWTSVSLLGAATVILHRPNPRSVWMGEIILPFTAVLGVFVFGLGQLRGSPDAERELNVTLVQPSIPQTLIWDPGKGAERFQQLLRLSELALTNQTDLLIWPEAALPELLRYDENTFQALTNLAVSHRVWMIVGSDDAEPAKDSRDPKDAAYFNSSFLISPDGRLMQTYKKRNLVIFGEYIPLVRWLPFIKWFTPVQGSFTPGTRAVPFELTGVEGSPPESQSESGARPSGVAPGQPVTTSVLICYEDTFPDLARDAVGPGTDFLVNITNDGWFGESAAQWQHAVTALFRAVENRLPLVRCTNTGLTCWYDSNGRLREFFTDANGSVYGAGFMTARIPLLGPGEQRLQTFYHRHGDWLGWACAGVVLLVLLTRRPSCVRL